MHFLSLSFASLLITIWSLARIYLYLYLFLLKFLFISKSSEWVLTFRFYPMTLSLHSLNVKKYNLSDISGAYLCSLSYDSISEPRISCTYPQETPRSFFFFPTLMWQWTISGEEHLLTATKDLCLTLAQSHNRSLQHKKHKVPHSNHWTVTQSPDNPTQTLPFNHKLVLTHLSILDHLHWFQI